MNKSEKIKTAFKNANSDQARWDLVRLHSENFKIILDNDETYADLDGEWLKFSESIGCMNGVFNLLESIGVSADYC